MYKKMPFVYVIINLYILSKCIACSLFLTFNLFYCNTSIAAYSSASKNKSFLEIYQNSSVTYIQNNDTLHVGIQKTNSIFFPIFAVAGNQEAAVKFVAINSMVLNGIFIETSIYGSKTQSGLVAKQSAFMLESVHNVTIQNGILVTPNVNIFGCKAINSDKAGIVLALPLVSNITNNSIISGDYGILFKNNGYLEGTITNFGTITANTAIGSVNKNINTRNNIALINKYSASIKGSIILEGANNSIENFGIISNANNSSFISRGIRSSITNSGTIDLYNIIPSSLQNYIFLNNTGYIHAEKNIVINTLYNTNKIITSSLVILDEATNTKDIIVDNLHISNSVNINNNIFKITSSKLTNLNTGFISINKGDLELNDKILHNEGTIHVAHNIILSGTLTNYGQMQAKKLLASSYQKLIINKSSTSCFKSLGDKNSNINIINHGILVAGSDSNDDNNKALFLGNISIHKDNNCNEDGNINLTDKVTQLEGKVNLGSITAINDAYLSIEEEAKTTCNKQLLQQKLNIENKGILQLEANNILSSYSSIAGTLIIKLNNNSIVATTQQPLLECINNFEIDRLSKIKIVPPKKTTKDISIKLYVAHAKKLVLSGLGASSRFFIEENINGNTQLFFTKMYVKNDDLTVNIIIRSLIGYHLDTEYAKQKIFDKNVFSMGIAWTVNNKNQKPLSNNLIVSPNILAMVTGLLHFDSVKQDLTVGSKTATSKYMCNTRNSLPALLIGTTVATDDNFIAAATTAKVNIGSISLFNLEIDGRNQIKETTDAHNTDAIVINGIHPLYLNQPSGLLLNKSVLIKAGATSCGLNIAAPMTGNITNNTTIGDYITGIAIGINNYFDGTLINNGTLDAANHAIYANPKKHGKVNVSNFSIINNNCIKGSIYLDINKLSLNSKIDLNNNKLIIANTITNIGNSNLHIINNQNGEIFTSDISATEIKNYGNITINNKIFSNKYCSFLNTTTGAATITNLYLDNILINDGKLFLNNLFSNNSTLTNNDIIDVGTITNIDVVNNKTFNIYSCISGKVNINKLTISGIVKTTKGSQLNTNSMQFANNGYIINIKGATISIGQIGDLSIKNNFDNYGNLIVKNTIFFDNNFNNKGIITANTITSTNNSCIFNQKSGSLFCNNLGSKNAKLSIIGSINIQDSATLCNVFGEIKLQANSLRQNDGEITLGNNLQQLTVNGAFSLGGISSKAKAVSLVINKNSFCDFSLPLKKTNFSVINSGDIEFIQGSEINNYNSNAGQLSLVISDINKIPNGLLNVINIATFDANSVIKLKYCDPINTKFTKKTITVVQCKNLKNSQSLNKLVTSIKAGSVLLTVTNTKITNNNIITDILPTSFIIANPNITTANQILYKNILSSQVKLTGKAWEINKDISSGNLSTNNLIISPISLLEDINIIGYDEQNKTLVIKSNCTTAQKVGSSSIKNVNNPPVVIGTTVEQDADFSVISSDKLDFNSILIDNIVIDGADQNGFIADKDGIVINGDSPIEMINNSILTIGYGATITAGQTSSALRIIPSFTGNIINKGFIGSLDSKNGITLDNFLAGTLNNENKIIAKEVALQINISKNQKNRNFIVNNNGEFIGDIVIEATKITDKFNVEINNNQLISSNTITANEKVYTALNNNKNAEMSVNYFNINKINNKGILKLLKLEYKISDKILQNSGDIYASNIIINDTFTNLGNIYITTSLSGISNTKKLKNNGLIVTDNIENITVYNTGILKVNKQITGRVSVDNTLTLAGNVIIQPKSVITSGALVGNNYQLINKATVTVNNLIVDKLQNKKLSYLRVTNNLELSADSNNYSTIDAKNFLIKSGTFTNKQNTMLMLANDKYFIIGDHNFNNLGSLYAQKIKIIKNFTNNGEIISTDLVTEATQIINQKGCLLSWTNINASNNLEIINKGNVYFNPSTASIILGTITIHKDNNKAKDGKLRITGTPYIGGNLTIGELENASFQASIHIQPSGKLSITLPFQQINTLINNRGVVSLCSGSGIQKYAATDKSSIHFNIVNIGANWLHSKFIQFHDGALIYITPEKSFTLGTKNKVKIVTSDIQIMNTRESGEILLLDSKSLKERVLYLDKYNRILHLSNINIVDANKSIIADIHVLDYSKLINNMIYANQTLNPRLLGYKLIANVSEKEILGVAWQSNFYKDSKNPQANNLIISPVALLQDNQLQFDVKNKILTIGLSKYSISATNTHPAIIIGNDVNPGGVFVKNSRATNSLILDSIHINNMNIIGGTNSILSASTSSVADHVFKSAILITGNNNIKLTNPLGLTLGTNTNITSNEEACLNFATTFLGDINNFSIITATNDAHAIKINQFFYGTITNRNIIKSNKIAIEIKNEAVKEAFWDIKQDNLQYFNIINEATISGDILIEIQRKQENITFASILNKKSISANIINISGRIETTITNTNSATLTIGRLNCLFNKINNYGYLEVATITDHFKISDKTFSNYGIAKLGSCIFSGSLTNNASLYIKNLDTAYKTTIYNNKYLQIENIYNSLNILNSDFLAINGECSRGSINTTGTLTVSKLLTTSNKCNLSCEKIDIKGKVINNNGCILTINSNLYVNNNFKNYGKLIVKGDIILLDNFDNKGDIYTKNLIGNNNYININQNKQVILNNIGAYNNNVFIINQGSLTITSIATETAKLYGDINIKENNSLNFSTFNIDGRIEYTSGALFARSFNALNKSTISINSQAMMIFSSNLQEVQVDINNHGVLELEYNSIINSYNGSDGSLCININSLSNQINNPLLSVEDIATLNKNSQIKLKCFDKNIPHQGLGVKVDILYAKNGLFYKDNKLKKLSTNDIINNISYTPVSSDLILSIDNISVANNAITAYISLHNISTLHGIMHPASQKLSEIPKKLAVYGIAWEKNKASNNNLIISPINIAIDKTIIRFSTVTNILKVGCYAGIRNIFSSDVMGALIIGNDLKLDSYFTTKNNSPVQLDKILIDNILIDGSIHNFDYSKVDNDGLIINGENGFNITNGIIIGKQAKIRAGASSSALNISTELKAKIINNGLIGDNNTGFGIFLRNTIVNGLANNGIIKANIAALKYNEYNANNKASFKIVNSGTIIGNMLFNSNKTQKNTKNIDIYNCGSINSHEISATEYTNVNIYNESSATILTDIINVKLLSNEGYIKITGADKFKINNNNFINNNTFIANNILLTANFTNNGKLYVDTLDGNYKTIKNNDYLQVKNIKNIQIENLAKLEINDNIYGKVDINGKLIFTKNIKINKHSKLTSYSLYSSDKLNNYGAIHVKKYASIAVLENQKNAELNVNGILEFNGHSENYGKIVAKNIQCINHKLSNLADGYIRVTGKDGFVIDSKLFDNNNKLIIDYGLLFKSDFVNNGEIVASNLQGNNIKFTIEENCKANFKNISNANNKITIINKGDLTIGVDNYTSSVISGNILVIKDEDEPSNANIILGNDVIQKSGVLHVGGIISNNDVKYTINNDALAIANTKFNTKINFINKGLLALQANSTVKEYNSEDGILVLTLNNKDFRDNLLQADSISLTKNSKIIINNIGDIAKNKHDPIEVVILSTKQGILYKDFNYKSYQLDQMLFAVSTNSILLKVSNIKATTHNLYANISHLDTSTFNNMSYTDTVLSKALLGDSQEDITVEGVSWESLKTDSNNFTSKKIAVSPYEIYTKDKALKLTSSGIEIEHEDQEYKDSSSISIHYSEILLANYEMASKYIKYLLNPLTYNEHPDLAQVFLNLKTADIDYIYNLTSNFMLPELNSGKVYSDFETTITIKDKISIRESKKVKNNKNAIIIAGDLDKISTLKAINIEKSSKLTTYATADALHVAIPSYVNINNMGIIGDKETGCGLKITQPISSTITNDYIISGKTAIALDIGKTISEASTNLCINNNGAIYGSVIANSLKNTQIINLNNFKTIIAESITEQNNSNIKVYNNSSGFIEATNLKISSLLNHGLVTINKTCCCKNITNEGTLHVNNDLLIENCIVNKGIISSTNIIGKPASSIINNNKIYVKNLKDITVNNNKKATLTVKNTIDGNVTITGGLHIVDTVLQKGVLTADYLTANSCYIIANDAICSLTKSMSSYELNIINHGTLNIQHSSTVNSYIAEGGELFIKIPYNFKTINRTLLFVENTASFNTNKAKLPKILFYTDIFPKYNNQTLIDNKKSLIKIISARKLLFNGYNIDKEVENILFMKMIARSSIFIRISDPYIARENGKEILYALLDWKKVDETMGFNNHPLSVKRLALLLQEKKVIAHEQDIIDIVDAGIDKKILPKEAKDIVSYFLQEQKHSNIYQKIISKIQLKLESCLAQEKNDLVNAVSSLIPDTANIGMYFDINVASSMLSTINNNFIKKRLAQSKDKGVNSSPYYHEIPVWHSFSFVKTKENDTATFKYNKWSSHLLNTGVDDKLTKDITIGIIASYAKTSITPINTSYNNSARSLTSMLASGYLQYASNNLQANLVFVLANNFHKADYRYSIIDKEYHAKYTTKLYGAMIELAYPCQFKNLAIDLSTAIKIFSSNTPSHNLGVYEKHRKACIKKAECSAGVSVSQAFYATSNTIFSYIISTMYSYDFNINNNLIYSRILGKDFIFRYNHLNKHQFTFNLNAGVNIKSRLGINCNIISTIQKNKSSFGLGFTAKYLF